jgi:hypothetical protein
VREPSPMPEAVINSVFRHARNTAHEDGDLAQRILREMWWDGLLGCYFFKLGTMLVGVELDGYMHT